MKCGIRVGGFVRLNVVVVWVSSGIEISTTGRVERVVLARSRAGMVRVVFVTAMVMYV